MTSLVETAHHAADDDGEALAAAGIVPPMRRKGNCLDNAPMKSFFHTLNVERIQHRLYAARAEARAATCS